MPILSVRGCDLYYEVHGESDNAIVFAHGGGGNHLSWWQQVPHFRGRFKCITFDHRGFGQSTDRSGEGRTAFTRDLEQLLDHLEVRKTALVGQSMGGFTCLPFAVAHPERVSALLMADTFLGIWDEALLAELGKVLESALDNAAAGAQTRMLGPSFVSNDPAGTFLYQQIRGLTSAAVSTESLDLLGQMGTYPASELKSLIMPVVFLAGVHDAIVPAKLVEAASRLVPNASYVPIADAGHSAYLERPEAFNKVLDALMERS